MAEITSSAVGMRSPLARTRRMSTKVDFTAMVDLAFLLITFFMLTTQLMKSNIMPIVMPENEHIDDENNVKHSQVLTLILGDNDKVYFYEGINDVHLDSTDFSSNGIRRVVLDKKDRVNAHLGEEEIDDPKRPGARKSVSKLYVIIKATKASRYKNVVDPFDEMKICEVARYAMLAISPNEEDFIRNPAAGLHFTVEEQMRANR